MKEPFFEDERKIKYTNVQFNDFTFLDRIKKDDIIVIDIETTGLKPHRKGHRIVCIGITRDKETVVFNSYPKKLHEILQDKEIKKIAHNLPFEANWIKVIWGYWVQNWYWDTMICNHILNNVASSGLKKIVKEKYNVEDYDFKVKKYLEAETSNDFNRIDELPIEDVMEYCGYDTYFTNKIYLDQIKEIKNDDHISKGFDFFMKAIQHFAFIQNNGIVFDLNQYKKNYSELTLKIKKLNNEIQNSNEVKLLENSDNFNFNSTKQLRNLFFEIMKKDSIKKTIKNFESVDEEVLNKMNTSFTKNILEHRHLSKIRDTYLKQFRKESVEIDGNYYIFPFFGLTIPATYRGSSYNPNFQNIPIRDELAKRMTRGTLVPRKGRCLLEIDFKGMEVAIGCCVHKDKNMIAYVKDKKNNMHTDTSALIFMKDKVEIDKKERFIAKNGFVFPSFYGSTSRMYNIILKNQRYGEITFNIWEMLTIEMKEHFKKKGIKNIFQFQKHIEKIEEYFWGDLFYGYQQWKFDNWKEYKEMGYIDLITGFRCTGKMGFNQANNFKIQGPAFHVMLWCLIQINEFLIQNNMKSMIIGQVHDSIIFDIDPLELEILSKIIKDICTKKVRQYFKWIIVPLQIEAEMTNVNESWDLKKEIIL